MWGRSSLMGLHKPKRLETPENNKRFAHKNERDFWQKVFIANISSGVTEKNAAINADRAITEFNERFK